ncbi:hypothetical protein CTI12_AA437360 [Artemisia annua]|uniref:Uncharacterized protein n=1 Tax=Artemisia annua TaxID=35608 RepID=A0A2U1LYK5_ARTAN|nr:hypothetical protein CTI12_AA437360 [Artemisia annua]
MSVTELVKRKRGRPRKYPTDVFVSVSPVMLPPPTAAGDGGGCYLLGRKGEGDVSRIPDIDFIGITLIRLSKLLSGSCQFPVKELSNGLKVIKDDNDLAEFVALGFKNKKEIDLYVEHHGYDLSHWLQNEIGPDEVSDDEIGEMEDIKGYGYDDAVGDEDVEIPNRTISDPFLNKLCNGNFINDNIENPDPTEFTQGTPKDIDSDEENVDAKYKINPGVIYPEHDPSVPWNQMKPTSGLRFEHLEQLKDCLTNYGVANGYQLWYKRNDYRTLMVLCGRNTDEGRSGGWKTRKGKDEGVQIGTPSKKGRCKGVLIRSPGKKGKQLVVHGASPSKKGKGKGVETKKKKAAKKDGCTFRLWASWVQDGSSFQIKTLIPEHTCCRNFDLGALCKSAKQRALFDHEGGLIEHYSRLWDYRQQLLNTNPGSSCYIHVEEKENAFAFLKLVSVAFTFSSKSLTFSRKKRLLMRILVRKVMSYDSHTNNVMVVGFQCDGKWMYSVSENGTINIWDLRAPGCQREYKSRAAVNTAVLDPNQGVVPGILGVALSGYLLDLTHSWYSRIDINDCLGYTVSYKFVSIVGINEDPQKGSSGTRGNNREWQPRMPKTQHYTDPYKFAPAVGINEGPEKGSRKVEAECDAAEVKMQEALETQIAVEEECVGLLESLAVLYETGKRMIYTGKFVDNGAQTAMILRDIAEKYSMFKKGKGGGRADSALTIGMTNWEECPELVPTTPLSMMNDAKE